MLRRLLRRTLLRLGSLLGFRLLLLGLLALRGRLLGGRLRGTTLLRDFEVIKVVTLLGQKSNDLAYGNVLGSALDQNLAQNTIVLCLDLNGRLVRFLTLVTEQRLLPESGAVRASASDRRRSVTTVTQS